MWTHHFALVDVCNVKAQRELLLAILAKIYILRHVRSPPKG
jgi:hypothetical protein